MDASAIITAGKKETESYSQVLQKIASQKPEKSIISYSCVSCSKVYHIDHPSLISQANLAQNSKKTLTYTCPKCGSSLEPYHKVDSNVNIHASNVYAQQTEKREDLEKTSSTYNTFSDMHFSLRALEEMNKFATKMGMLGARTRYIRSEHTKIAGQDYPTLNTIDCEIEWLYGRKQKARVYASLSRDIAGKYIYPEVFSLPDGSQHPFTKEYIQDMERHSSFHEMMIRKPKKSDTPTFRKPDITRFRSFGSLQKQEYQYTPQPMAQTPTTPTPNTQYQTGQQVINPSDGKTYNVKTPSSGTGMVVTDPQTGQDAMVPQNQIPNVKPVVKTQTSHLKTAEEMANDLMENFLHNEIDDEKDEISQHLEMAENDKNEIEKAKALLDDEDGDDQDIEGSDDEMLAQQLQNRFDGKPFMQTDEHDEEISGQGTDGFDRGYFAESSLKKNAEDYENFLSRVGELASKKLKELNIPKDKEGNFATSEDIVYFLDDTFGKQEMSNFILKGIEYAINYVVKVYRETAEEEGFKISSQKVAESSLKKKAMAIRNTPNEEGIYKLNLTGKDFQLFKQWLLGEGWDKDRYDEDDPDMKATKSMIRNAPNMIELEDVFGSEELDELLDRFVRKHGKISSQKRVAVSPPGRKHEIEQMKEKGTPEEEAFAIAWKQNEEHGKPKKKNPKK